MDQLVDIVITATAQRVELADSSRRELAVSSWGIWQLYHQHGLSTTQIRTRLLDAATSHEVPTTRAGVGIGLESIRKIVKGPQPARPA